MAQFDWENLLTRWSRDLLACPEVAQTLPPEVLKSGWLGYAPATEDQVRRTEARLGATLPPSYREFVKVSNGWRTTGFFIERLFSTEEIDWFRNRHQELIDAALRGAQLQGKPLPVPDEQYFVYGDEQEPHKMRWEYLQTTVQVSELWDTNVYLLNPRVVTPEGEWEAWFLAHWLLGATRYRSFWELMEGEYMSFLQLKDRRKD